MDSTLTKVLLKIQRTMRVSNDKLFLRLADAEWMPRYKLAESIETAPDVLASLADDEQSLVREQVAKNINTPSYILEILAQGNNDHNIKTAAGNNPNTPEAVLRNMVETESSLVLLGVASNKSLPEDILMVLLAHKRKIIRIGVVQHSNMPVDMLNMLAKSSDRWIRFSVAKNKTTPLELVHLLATDKSKLVRDKANEILSMRANASENIVTE